MLVEACVMHVFGGCHQSASLVAQTIKNMPAMRETWVQSLGWEYSPGEGNSHPLQYPDLENSMEEPGRLQSTGLQRVRHNFHFHQFHWCNFPFHHLLDLYVAPVCTASWWVSKTSQGKLTQGLVFLKITFKSMITSF